MELFDERFGDGTSEPLSMLLQAAALASDARRAKKWFGVREVKGDPTEGALVVVAAKAGLNKPALDAQFRAFPKFLSPPRRSE